MRERIIARRNQKRKKIILGAPQNRKEKGMGNPSSVRKSSIYNVGEKKMGAKRYHKSGLNATECQLLAPFHIREYESKTNRKLNVKPGRYKLRDVIGILEPRAKKNGKSE
jgi:hypothetical protein